MKFTVIIPTFNRPGLLKTALESVSKQTAVARIDKVIVSENGLNRESEGICLSFDNINISYKYQEQQLSVSKHMQWLMSLEKENHVAFLCDDDWWDISHLELAAHHLNENKECSAYFSRFIYADNECTLKFNMYPGLRGLHLGKNNYVNYLPCVYTMGDVFNYSFMFTPFHFSSLICRGDILAKAVAIFDRTHPTYADRILWTVIGSMTNIVFNPIATAIVRWHADMDTHRYSSKEWMTEWQNGSLLVLELADKQGYDLKQNLNQIYRNSSSEDAKFMRVSISDIFLDRKKITWFAGYEEIIAQDVIQESYRYRVKSFARRAINKIVREVL